MAWGGQGVEGAEREALFMEALGRLVAAAEAEALLDAKDDDDDDPFADMESMLNGDEPAGDDSLSDNDDGSGSEEAGDDFAALEAMLG